MAYFQGSGTDNCVYATRESKPPIEARKNKVNKPRFKIVYSHQIKDLDDSFRAQGGRLWIFHGDPKEVFLRLLPQWGVTHVSFELDLEPIWQERDCGVIHLLEAHKIEVIDRVSYTLWDPRDVVKANGGSPPLTFGLFMLTVSTMPFPPEPLADPDFSDVDLVDEDPSLPADMAKRIHVPSLEEMGVVEDVPGQKEGYVWEGGEKVALLKLEARLENEKEGISQGQLQVNIYKPNLVNASRSLSPFIRFGCISVRLFYHRIMDLCYNEPQLKDLIHHSPTALTAQLIWREYFYTMSINNPNFDKITGNPVCLPVPWKDNDEHLQAWKEGLTGYPWIDALQKQIDGDWAVGVGNWMWVSSSAFEKALDCAKCMCPVNYGRRMDPHGNFVKKYLPQLKDMPLRYLFNPWTAPDHVQEKAGCVIGKDYPPPIVDHKYVSKRNSGWMEDFKKQVVERIQNHVRPTTYSEEELKTCALETHRESCKSCCKRSKRQGEDDEEEEEEEDWNLMD